jgi:hypothetical protein
MEPQQVVAIIVPVLVILVLVAGTLFARRRGFNVGSAQTIVRCLEGHLFTTIWFPGFSLKALRFGPLRLQRCPIGDHLTFVTPVRPSDLTDYKRRFAEQHHDDLVP